jgi:hypothetical protein
MICLRSAADSRASLFIMAVFRLPAAARWRDDTDIGPEPDQAHR